MPASTRCACLCALCWACTWSGMCPHQTWFFSDCTLHSASASLPDLLPFLSQALHVGGPAAHPLLVDPGLFILLTLEIPPANPALQPCCPLCARPCSPIFLPSLGFNTASYRILHQIVPCLSRADNVQIQSARTHMLDESLS